jgi:hypothetical protein
MTVTELIDLLSDLPGEARVVVPMHGAFRDADCLAAKLALEGAGPGAHQRLSADSSDASSVDAVIVCTRAKAAELREES